MPVEAATIVRCLYCGSFFMSVVGAVKTPSELGGGRAAQEAHVRALALLQEGNAAGAGAVVAAALPRKKGKHGKQGKRKDAAKREEQEARLRNLMQRRQEQDEVTALFADAAGLPTGGDASFQVMVAPTPTRHAVGHRNGDGTGGDSGCDGGDCGDGGGRGGAGGAGPPRPDFPTEAAAPPAAHACNPAGPPSLLACPTCGCLATGLGFDEYARSRDVETVLTHCLPVSFEEGELAPLYVFTQKTSGSKPRWHLRQGVGPPTLELDRRSDSSCLYAPCLRKFGLPMPPPLSWLRAALPRGDAEDGEGEGGRGMSDPVVPPDAVAAAVAALEHRLEERTEWGERWWVGGAGENDGDEASSGVHGAAEAAPVLPLPLPLPLLFREALPLVGRGASSAGAGGGRGEPDSPSKGTAPRDHAAPAAAAATHVATAAAGAVAETARGGGAGGGDDSESDDGGGAGWGGGNPNHQGIPDESSDSDDSNS